ncbi:unnamed protein product, partial [Brugia timori]|uniref:Ovule protein n=1 Tax=Brugia timori TaxID=42155 RepID=A0A0R3QF20_9BILA
MVDGRMQNERRINVVLFNSVQFSSECQYSFSSEYKCLKSLKIFGTLSPLSKIKRFLVSFNSLRINRIVCCAAISSVASVR